MRRKVCLAIVLGFIGICIVAIVRAQDTKKGHGGDRTEWRQPERLPIERPGQPQTKSLDAPARPFSPMAQPSAPPAPLGRSTSPASPTRQPTSLEKRLEAVRRSGEIPSKVGATAPAHPKEAAEDAAKTPSLAASPATGTSAAAGVSSPNDPGQDKAGEATGVESETPSVLTSHQSAHRAAPAAPVSLSPKGGTDGALTSSRRRAHNEQSPSAPTSAPQNAVLFAGEGPALAVQTTGPRTIVIGKEASYVVTMANSADAVAKDVVVSVHLPKWAELVASDATGGTVRPAEEAGGASGLKWTVGQLDGRRRQKLTLKIVPRESRPIDLTVGWTFTPVTLLAQIEVQEPKLEMTLFGPKELLFGETKIYTITLTNPGTGDAENVVVNLLPIIPGQEQAGATKIGTLKAGDQKVIEVELTARQAGNLAIKAQSFADGGLRAEASADVVVRRARLQVAVGGPKVAYAGTAATYRIQVANTGDATAEGVVVDAVLPTGAKLVSSTEGGALDEKQGRLRWQVGALRAGTERTLEVKCVLHTAGGNRLELRAEAAGDLAASGAAATQVEALADLKLTTNDPQGPVPVGEDAVYEVSILNRGTKAAENVSAVFFFSEGIEPVAVEGGHAKLKPGQVILDAIPRVSAGQELTVKITARAGTAGNHVFRAEVQCADPETRLVSEETTRFYATDISESRQATLSRPTNGPVPAEPRPLGIRR